MSEDSVSRVSSSYTVHNFDHINAHVKAAEAQQELLLQRSRIENQLRLSQVFMRYAVGGSAIVIVLAAIIWLCTHSLEGMVTLNYSSNELVKFEEYLAKLTQLQEGMLEQRNGANSQIASLAEKHKKSAASSSNKISTEFTVFKSVELEGGREVITGYTYSPEHLDKPNYQYCYMTKIGDPERKISERINIAYKKDKNIIWDNPSDEVIALGKANCVFLNK